MHACPWLPWLLDVIQWSIEAGQTSETQYYYLQYTYVQCTKLITNQHEKG